MQKCIEKGFKQFYYHFVYRIEKLLQLNPTDLKNKDGSFFWSGSKRMPSVLDFDINDKLCKEFIFSYANILARCFGIEIKSNISDEELINLNKKIKLYKFEDNEINGDNENEGDIDIDNKQENTENSETSNIKEEEKINNLVNVVKSLLKEVNHNSKINPEIFNKDDDTNGQINFIYCFSNLRARNYKINECDSLKVKFIAGRIIPAIESTTAAVTGFNASQIFALLINDIYIFYLKINLTQFIVYILNCFFIK